MENEAQRMKRETAERYRKKFAELLTDDPNEMISIPKSLLKDEKCMHQKLLPAYIQTHWNHIAAMPGKDHVWNARLFLFDKYGIKFPEEDIKPLIGKIKFKSAKMLKEAKGETL